MQTLDVSNFLKSGAFVRTSPQRWSLFEHLVSWESTPNELETSLYFPDFFLKDVQPWACFEKRAELSDFEFQQFLNKYPQKNSPVQKDILQKKQMGSTTAIDDVERWEWQEPLRENFAEYFSVIKNKMSEGLRKAVPVIVAQSEQVPDSRDIFYWCHKLMDAEDHLYPYAYWDFEKKRGCVGVTPEILFRYDGTCVQTMALAGTRASESQQQNENEGENINKNKSKKEKFSEKGESLLNDAKEMKEHLFVVEGIESAFNELRKGPEFDVNFINREATREINIGSLTHLQTALTVKCVDLNLSQVLSLLEKLHPTPALGVFPSDQKDILLEICNPSLRHEFGAPFLLKNKNDYFCGVAIRNIIWRGDKTYLHSGCGVVEESLEDSEWAELQKKRSYVRNWLGI